MICWICIVAHWHVTYICSFNCHVITDFTLLINVDSIKVCLCLLRSLNNKVSVSIIYRRLIRLVQPNLGHFQFQKFNLILDTSISKNWHLWNEDERWRMTMRWTLGAASYSLCGHIIHMFESWASKNINIMSIVVFVVIAFFYFASVLEVLCEFTIVT